MVRKGASNENPLLELLYYRGRYQLATFDALYSDGNRYTPLRLALKKIRTELRGVKDVLVLGTGLGSAVQIMYNMGYSPRFTLVEHDSTVLKWAMELLPQLYPGQVTTICSDAKKYMSEHTAVHDLVIVDIFNSRLVPAFVTKEEFLTQCRGSIRPGGHFIFNYIIQNNEDWLPVDKTIRSVFPVCYCIDNGLNRIVIATV